MPVLQKTHRAGPIDPATNRLPSRCRWPSRCRCVTRLHPSFLSGSLAIRLCRSGRFFVISGFVVTLSILSGGYGHGTTGMLEFWRRRILRIMPALAAFIFLTSIAYAAFFALNTQVQFTSALRTGMSALLGISNLYLISIGDDYFLADTSTNVFTHTWSLGVEEQFYAVLAPLVFALLSQNRQTLLPSVLAALAVLSFIAFVLLSPGAPISSYYGLHTRFWELAVGALLAMALANHGLRTWLWRPLSGLGALMILTSSLLPGELGGFRGAIIMAVIGTALLILSGGNQASPIQRILCLKPVVFIGLISYGLYLWHWPILVFMRWNSGINLASFCVAVICATTLAWMSYKFVEVPARRIKAPLLRP